MGNVKPIIEKKLNKNKPIFKKLKNIEWNNKFIIGVLFNNLLLKLKFYRNEYLYFGKYILFLHNH